MSAYTLAPAPYVLIPLASIITGLSEKAIRRKIDDGVWVDGREYRRGPDGHIYISVEGIKAWVEKGLTFGLHPSESRSRTKANKSAAPSS
jgi:hypothetical protein